jgi:hypothetical protein
VIINNEFNYFVRYQMVYLLNRELSFDVDLSTVGCGFDASLFFVAMEEDGGMASNGYTLGPSMEREDVTPSSQFLANRLAMNWTSLKPTV